MPKPRASRPGDSSSSDHWILACPPTYELTTIDEAIYLAPGVEYFREQRRRFSGEREPEDRPDPPTEPWLWTPEPLPPVPAQEEPGIRV